MPKELNINIQQMQAEASKFLIQTIRETVKLMQEALAKFDEIGVLERILSGSHSYAPEQQAGPDLSVANGPVAAAKASKPARKYKARKVKSYVRTLRPGNATQEQLRQQIQMTLGNKGTPIEGHALKARLHAYGLKFSQGNYYSALNWLREQGIVIGGTHGYMLKPSSPPPAAKTKASKLKAKAKAKAKASKAEAGAVSKKTGKPGISLAILAALSKNNGAMSNLDLQQAIAKTDYQNTGKSPMVNQIAWALRPLINKGTVIRGQDDLTGERTYQLKEAAE